MIRLKNIGNFSSHLSSSAKRHGK